MALVITVGGVDVSQYVDVKNLTITQVLTRRGDTAKFDVLDSTLAMTFAPMQQVTITDELGNTLFAGVASQVRMMTDMGPAVNRWRFYQCQDWSYYLQHTLANKKYQAMTVDAIVKDLLASFPPGVAITTNNVQAQLPTIQTFNANHLTLADAFDKLVKLSNATAFLMWDVDPAKDLHFYDQYHVPPADVTLSDAVPTGNGYANYRRDTWYYDQDATQFANQVTFRGGTTLSIDYTQTWVGNGQQTSFPFDYPPDTSSQNGGYTPTVTVAGVGQTVALDTGAGFGANQALVSVAQDSQTATLRFASPPASGAVIQATYVYDIPVLVRRKNVSSVASYGVWEQYLVDTTVKSLQEAAQKAGSTLAQFASPLATARMDVDMTYRGNLGAGQLVTLVNGQFGIAQQMICTDCRITGKPGGHYQRQVTLAAYG